RELKVWLRLKHQTIVPLLGFAYVNSSSKFPALVSQWMPSGMLSVYLKETTIITAFAKVKGVAAGLDYLHGSNMVHGNITSSNVLVDIKEGEYIARLTGFSLATIFSGCLGDRTFGSNVRTGAIRWIAPELLKVHDQPANGAPTTQTDIYSFGRVMFHVLTLVIPWNDMNDIVVLQRILRGEDISRPATPDMTTARWNEIAQCWSSDVSARPPLCPLAPSPVLASLTLRHARLRHSHSLSMA
ncbi:kinase-like domain-containing protein, partial [Suillus fuscotomentosus]